jgi:hypothetical protein
MSPMRVLANNLYEQVYSEDVEEQAVLVRDTLTGLNNIYERLKAQGAPAGLTEVIFEMRQELSDCLDKFDEVKDCFPPRPYIPPRSI